MIGKVVRVKKDKPPVINFNGQIVSLDRVRFEIYDPEQEKVLVVRCQNPNKLAFALTVHSAQGQTKANTEIDCYSFRCWTTWSSIGKGHQLKGYKGAEL